MGKKKKKKQSKEEVFLKAFKKSNREIQFLRNGGGQWVSQNQIWKNKKAYNRKRDKKVDLTDCLVSSLYNNGVNNVYYLLKVNWNKEFLLLFLYDKGKM